MAHFEPDNINICGEGVFPRISLDLPRFEDPDGQYSSMLKESKETLGRDVKKSSKQSARTDGSDTNRDGSTPLPHGTTPTPRDVNQDDASRLLTIQVCGHFDFVARHM